MTEFKKPKARRIVGGVDTHADTHHAAVVLMNGRRVADHEFPVTRAGYADLLEWMRSFNQLKALIEQARPELLITRSVGVETAAQLLTTCGDNPDRLFSEGLFATCAGCRLSPHPAAEHDAIGSTVAAPGRLTAPCTSLCFVVCPAINPPVPMLSAEPPRDCPRKSSAV
ncbi:hypothetical protein AB0K40_21620 [Nonomuraea bangladeshensis]|uniref:Transposase IS111A/IS1328/IS1533 N-terminal domain-containing protein n=1 Tax=Nonomuraea bangladeshensis TaxID=404385 RepID=A0ABV3H6G7_9ACTN